MHWARQRSGIGMGYDSASVNVGGAGGHNSGLVLQIAVRQLQQLRLTQRMTKRGQKGN
jgi:hypothetical protein